MEEKAARRANGWEKEESSEEEVEAIMDGSEERREAALREVVVVEKEDLLQWITEQGKARVMGRGEAQIPAVATIADKRDTCREIAHRKEKERAKERTALGLGG